MIANDLQTLVKKALKELSIVANEVVLEHPGNIDHGDFSTNIALALSKITEKNPREFAQDIASKIDSYKDQNIARVEVAGAGFINFYLSKTFFSSTLAEILENTERVGRNETLSGKRVMVEYTDPNPFKEFHIGHLMSNTIGESVSRLFEFQGAEVKRACYQGDVGLHVAMAMWGILNHKEEFERIAKESLSARVKFMGACYAEGSTKETELKQELQNLNKKIFDRSDEEINKVYDLGRKWSLEYFEELYHRLGTKFDFYFFESQVWPLGKETVLEALGRGIFEKSEGAVIYPGEKHGLHTRVFINSQGLPTYEAKELALARTKYDAYPYQESVVVTGNEINEYFKVLLSAMSFVFPELREKTTHLSHGMMRLPSGKMSSRKGVLVTAKSLIDEIEALVHQKIAERELMDNEKNKIADVVAIGAIKFSILRQAIGGDVIYDFEKSISFEGDSGPYLQYSYTRARSVVEKAHAAKQKASVARGEGGIYTLEKWLYRFPEIVRRAGREHAPHQIATYLLELSSSFNAFYAQHKIVDPSDPEASYRLALVEAFAATMKNGLYLLGIKAPEKM